MTVRQGSSLRALHDLVADELLAPVPPAALALAEAIRARHEGAISSVVFYGSCLRKSTHEGVLDFYVLVDSYRAAHGPGWLAASNALLPPSVFYLETEAALFDSGLGLDSIDALEIAIALENEYGVTVEDDPEKNQEIFASVASLARFVIEKRPA